jgi:hypothetical protein
MLAKVIIVMTALVFVGTMSAGSEAWARGGRGGGGGKGSGWAGKGSHGMHGKHGRHFPGQMHGHNKKHDRGNKDRKDQAQGNWQKGNSDFRRNWQAGGFASGSGGYGGGDSVGDVCINSQFCQGVWYRSGNRTESSAGYQKNGQGGGK